MGQSLSEIQQDALASEPHDVAPYIYSTSLPEEWSIHARLPSEIWSHAMSFLSTTQVHNFMHMPLSKWAVRQVADRIYSPHLPNADDRPATYTTR